MRYIKSYGALRSYAKIDQKPKKMPKRGRLAYERLVNLRKRITPAERVMLSLLKSVGLRYKFQKVFFIKGGTFYIVDFWLPEKRTVIEIDGMQHYRSRKQNSYDEKRTEYLERVKKVKVIRFTNETVLECPNEVKEYLESLR
jgi:very-short-patch-repair endonuclease